MVALAELDMQLPIEVTDHRLLPHWDEADRFEHRANLHVAHRCRGCHTLTAASHTHCNYDVTLRAVRRSILNTQETRDVFDSSIARYVAFWQLRHLWRQEC